VASLQELQVCLRILKGFVPAVEPHCGKNVKLLDSDSAVCAVHFKVFVQIL